MDECRLEKRSRKLSPGARSRRKPRKDEEAMGKLRRSFSEIESRDTSILEYLRDSGMS